MSKSDEYCFDGNTAARSLCDAARSCPVSNVSAAGRDTFSAAASTFPGTPDVSCGAEYIPRASFGVHRKMPASAELHADEYRWPEVFWDGLYGSKPSPAGDEFPEGRIRRMTPSGHLRQVGLRIGESVFFRLKLWVVAFFPCFDSPEPDFFLVENSAKRFNADREDNFFVTKIFSEFFKRPSFERTIQKVRRTFGRFGDKSLIVFGEFLRSAGAGFRFNCVKAVFVKVFDNGSDMVLRVVNQFCNGRHFIALIGGKNHLGTPDLDTAGTATQDTLNLLAFADTKVSGIQTHKKSLSLSEIFRLFLCVCLYNTIMCRAQVLNMQNVKIIFLKRH